MILTPDQALEKLEMARAKLSEATESLIKIGSEYSRVTYDFIFKYNKAVGKFIRTDGVSSASEAEKRAKDEVADLKASHEALKIKYETMKEVARHISTECTVLQSYVKQMEKEYIQSE